jgi:hypothetical protein
MDGGGSYLNSPPGSGGAGGGIDAQQLNARFMGLGGKERALMEDYLQANSDEEDQPSSAPGQGQVHLPRIDAITPKLLSAALLKKGLEGEVRDEKNSPRELSNSASVPQFFGSSAGPHTSARPSMDVPVTGKQAAHYTSPRGSRDSSLSVAAWMPTPRAPDEPFQSSGAAPRNHGSYYRGASHQNLSSPMNVSTASLHNGSDEGNDDRDMVTDDAQIEDLRNALQANMFGGGFGGGGSDKGLGRRPQRGGSP